MRRVLSVLLVCMQLLAQNVVHADPCLRPGCVAFALLFTLLLPAWNKLPNSAAAPHNTQYLHALPTFTQSHIPPRELHIREDERHGRQMLDDVALPLVDM